jgi:hypothetical protein
MFWHDSKKEKPQHSTAMEIHRVVVWYHDAWATGYYIGDPLNEWRLDNSPSRFTDADMPYWMEVPAPKIEAKKIIHEAEFNGFVFDVFDTDSGSFGMTVSNPKHGTREGLDIFVTKDIKSLSCDFGSLHEYKEEMTTIKIPGDLEYLPRTVLVRELMSVQALVKQNMKIAAIKSARAFWGLGLKEAKDFIESL